MTHTRVNNRLLVDFLCPWNSYKSLWFSCWPIFSDKAKKQPGSLPKLSQEPSPDNYTLTFFSEMSWANLHSSNHPRQHCISLWYFSFCSKHSAAFPMQTLQAHSPPNNIMARNITLIPKSRVLISVLGYLLLRRDTLSMTTLVKENIYLSLADSLRELFHYWQEGSLAACRQTLEKEVNIVQLDPQAVESYCHTTPCLSTHDLTAYLKVRHFCQQGHTYSIEDIPANRATTPSGLNIHVA